MTQDSNRTWLSIKEVAARLHISLNSVRRAIYNGELRATRLGRGYRIEPDSLQKFVEKRTKGRVALG